MRLPVLTKIGPDAKEKGFIVSLKSMLHVGLVTCCVFAVLVLFCVQTKRAISIQTRRYEDDTKIRVSHIVKIGMQLEAYIKDAQVRSKRESQLMERVNELEEKLRFDATQKFDIAFDYFEAELKVAIGQETFDLESVQKRVSHSRRQILKLIDNTIGGFGDELEILDNAFEKERDGANRDEAQIENLEKVREIVRGVRVRSVRNSMYIYILCRSNYDKNITLTLEHRYE